MAFTSLYCQLPGLFGFDGITPIYLNMIGKKQQFRTEDNMRMFSAFPSFLWFSDKINAVVVRLAPGLSAFHEVDNSMH